MKLVNFKAEEEDYLRWKEEARRESITFGEWARRRLNHSPVIAPALVEVKQSGITSTKSTSGGKTCEHKLPRGAWCKTCRKIRA